MLWWSRINFTGECRPQKGVLYWIFYPFTRPVALISAPYLKRDGRPQRKHPSLRTMKRRIQTKEKGVQLSSRNRRHRKSNNDQFRKRAHPVLSESSHSSAERSHTAVGLRLVHLAALSISGLPTVEGRSINMKLGRWWNDNDAGRPNYLDKNLPLHFTRLFSVFI
jgi:hypothetical protein